MLAKPSKIRPLFMQCSIYFFILHLLLQFSKRSRLFCDRFRKFRLNFLKIFARNYRIYIYIRPYSVMFVPRRSTPVTVLRCDRGISPERSAKLLFQNLYLCFFRSHIWVLRRGRGVRWDRGISPKPSTKLLFQDLYLCIFGAISEFSGEAGVWGSAPPSLPSPSPARSGPPAYTGFPITDILPVCWVPRDRHDHPTQEGAAVKGTVEYRSPSGEDMPRKPLDSCKAARPPVHHLFCSWIRNGFRKQ